jgi:hypothetical protein
MASTALRMKERSGALLLLRGVGTQMSRTSWSWRRWTSMVAVSPPECTTAARSASPISTRWERAAWTAATRSASISKPVTGKPARARASVRPT